MIGVGLFGHGHPIHAQVDVSKDGVGKIVDAVGVSGIVGIRVGQIGFEALIPSRRIGQTDFDLKSEFVEIVIIVRGRDGKGDGSRPRQGGLKHCVPGGLVPVIHIGHIKQLSDMMLVSDCQSGSTAVPFYSVSASGHGDHPFGVHPGGVGVHTGITHARGLAKEGAPFHRSA